MFEHYIWHGVYYACKVSLLLPSERRKEKVLSSPRSRSIRTLRLAWRLLSTPRTIATSVQMILLAWRLLYTWSTYAAIVRTPPLAGHLLCTQSKSVSSTRTSKIEGIIFSLQQFRWNGTSGGMSTIHAKYYPNFGSDPTPGMASTIQVEYVCYFRRNVEKRN